MFLLSVKPIRHMWGCAQVVQAVQSAEAAHGAVDMLICCAGAAELGKQLAQVVVAATSKFSEPHCQGKK
jgi:NAD(P)-dependent dehydrogenase (short-subunit alcohol dehydrogenase family)